MLGLCFAWHDYTRLWIFFPDLSYYADYNTALIADEMHCDAMLAR
jgi:hypothetical protein